MLIPSPTSGRGFRNGPVLLSVNGSVCLYFSAVMAELFDMPSSNLTQRLIKGGCWSHLKYD